MAHLTSTMQNIAASEAKAATSEEAADPVTPSLVDPPFAMPPDEPAPDAVFVGPVPGLGETVVYHSHEWRSGAREFAAIVTKVHRDDAGKPNGLLDMVVVFDADDFMGQRNVRPYVDSSGWSPIERGDDALSEIDKLASRMGEVVLGAYEAPKVSIMQQIVNLTDEIAELRGQVETLMAGRAPPAKKPKRK